jgi:TetR/AcrR family transcriptional regulator, ethionamide resistance regulator
MAAEPSPATAPARGRRAARVSAQEREAAILATAERLLEDRSPQEISVDDLARGAGISRPTFYFYFSSKEAVFLTLIDRLVAQAEPGGELIERIHEDPPTRWREGLQIFFDIFGAHRAVVRAGAELRAVNAEARQLWSEVMEGWVAQAAGAIDAERARGAAPPGVDSRQLAIALVSMNERVQYATFADEPPSLPDDAVMDVLLEIWLKSIYGEAGLPLRT